jgi:hypothetical protein
MQTYGDSSAIMSGVPVTAPTAEMSILAAMGGFAPVPQVLAGILRDAPIETHNAARLARFVKISEEISQAISATAPAPVEAAPEVAEVEAEVAEVAEEQVFADLTESGILVENGGDIAEVVALVTDAQGMWARIVYAESGEALDIHADHWEAEFGTDAEMELLTAWDRADVARMRSTLIAA